VQPGATLLNVFASDAAAPTEHPGPDPAAIGGLSTGGQIMMELQRLKYLDGQRGALRLRTSDRPIRIAG